MWHVSRTRMCPAAHRYVRLMRPAWQRDTRLSQAQARRVGRQPGDRAVGRQLVGRAFADEEDRRRRRARLIRALSLAAPTMAMDRVAYAGLLLLGAANLVPWMAFLSLSDYFSTLYHSNAMEFWFPAFSTSALIASSATLLVVGQKLSFTARIAFPTLMMALLMLVVPILDVMLRFELISLDTAFALTLASVMLNSVFSATTQNSLYALGSLLSDEATQAVQAGSGIIGLVSVCLRLATKVGLAPTPAMWAFCVIGTLILLASLAAYTALSSDSNVKAKIMAHEQRRADAQSKARGGDAGAELGEAMLGGGANGGAAHVGHHPTALSVLALTWVPSCSVYVVFLVTLATFPGLTTSLVSTTWQLGDWYPLLLVAVYNAADLLGKSLPGVARLLSRRTLPLAAAAHALFVPIFVMLAHPERLPPILQGDGVAVAIVGALGVCTGYIGCMALMLGGEMGRTPEEREVAGMVTSFALMLGLASGSNAGLLLSRLVDEA